MLSPRYSLPLYPAHSLPPVCLSPAISLRAPLLLVLLLAPPFGRTLTSLRWPCAFSFPSHSPASCFSCASVLAFFPLPLYRWLPRRHLLGVFYAQLACLGGSWVTGLLSAPMVSVPSRSGFPSAPFLPQASWEPLTALVFASPLPSLFSVLRGVCYFRWWDLAGSVARLIPSTPRIVLVLVSCPLPQCSSGCGRLLFAPVAFTAPSTPAALGSSFCPRLSCPRWYLFSFFSSILALPSFSVVFSSCCWWFFCSRTLPPPSPGHLIVFLPRVSPPSSAGHRGSRVRRFFLAFPSSTCRFACVLPSCGPGSGALLRLLCSLIVVALFYLLRLFCRSPFSQT